MPLFNNNDRESSKPMWLTEEQKRNCFRTVRGWEIPLTGCGVTGSPTASPYYNRSGTYVGPTELLVAMPYDASPTGQTNSNMAGAGINIRRGQTGPGGGLTGTTAGSDLPDSPPYFCTPITGDVLRCAYGVTQYIPLIAADCNITDIPSNYTFTLTGAGGGSLSAGVSLLFGVAANTGFTGAGTVGAIYFNQSTCLTGSRAFAGTLDQTTGTLAAGNRFGGWGGLTHGAACVRITPAAGATFHNLLVTVNNNRLVGGSQTGYMTFRLDITGNTGPN
jgi:hypothetical protein